MINDWTVTWILLGIAAALIVVTLCFADENRRSVPVILALLCISGAVTLNQKWVLAPVELFGFVIAALATKLHYRRGPTNQDRAECRAPM